MVRRLAIVLIAAWGLLILAVSQSVVAHGGGLNALGCHMERATGGCHCHRGKDFRKLSPPVPCEKKPNDVDRSEAHFVAVFCLARDGKLEKKMPHRRRADCITEGHAIEGDFAHKWEEAYSQS